jgi:hypothetical protein
MAIYTVNRSYLLDSDPCFERLAVASPRISHPLGGGNHVVYAASPRISHPLGGGNHVVYAASHPLQHPSLPAVCGCPSVAKK